MNSIPLLIVEDNPIYAEFLRQLLGVGLRDADRERRQVYDGLKRHVHLIHDDHRDAAVQCGVVHARTPAVPGNHKAEDGGGEQLRIVALDVVVPADAVRRGVEGTVSQRAGRQAREYRLRS